MYENDGGKSRGGLTGLRIEYQLVFAGIMVIL